VELIIIFALNILLYAKTLRYKYVSDDLSTFHNPPKWKNKFHKWFLWVLAQYKWTEKWDHLMTTLVHSAVAMMIYLAFGANQVSFWAALLFSANPANNQASIWISGRGYALATLLLLISLYSPFLAPFSLFGCAYFNIGYLAPLALVGSNNWHVLIWMPFIWWFWWKRFRKDVVFKAKNEEVVEDSKFHLRKLVLAIKTVGFYLSLCLIPFRITFYHSFLQSCAGNDIMKRRAYTMKDKFFWIGLFSIIGWLSYIYFRGWDLFSYGMFWFYVTIAPFSNLRRVQQECAERYMYMANVGVMIGLVSLIINYPVLLVVFLTMYISRLYTTMRMYSDDFWLIEEAVLEDPGAWYAWHVRGFKRWNNESWREALTMWVMANMISPREFKVLFNIACVLKLLGKKDEAEQFIKKAEANIIPGQEVAAQEAIKEFHNNRLPLLI